MANHGSVQRHFSDKLDFVPKNPSRLGPGRNTVLPRGTVSLPTSPLLGSSRQVESIWPDPPQSAQAFFNLPDPDQNFEPPPWYSDTYPSSSEIFPLSLDDPFAPLRPDEAVSDASPAQIEPSSGPVDGAGGMKKKRAQVRIACTHCQKACKKCSNTRPCDRCVKYGLTDCVDSTRKPRKTGVKRGPYKRRSSGKYSTSNSYYPSSSPSASQDSPSYPPSSGQGFAQHRPYHVYTPENTQIMSPSIHSGGYTSPPHPNSHPHAPSHFNAQPPHSVQQYPHDSILRNVPPPHRHTVAISDPTGVPPGPRTAALHGAFAQALGGPRWVHGQRTGPSTTGEVLYPPTPVVPFPISLNHRDDPFSRAVSPIHGDLDTALQSLQPSTTQSAHLLGEAQHAHAHIHVQAQAQALAQGSSQTSSQGQYGYPRQHQDIFNRLNVNGNGSESSSIEFTNPFEPLSTASSSHSHISPEIHAASAPTSPRMTENWSAFRQNRSSSLEPLQTSHPAFSHPLSQTPTFQSSQSPGLIALTKIRKPSLRTLMSHGGSLAPSRQVSPVPEESQSPTLFDQPMELDEVDSLGMDVELGVWAGVKQEERKVVECVGLGSPFE